MSVPINEGSTEYSLVMTIVSTTNGKEVVMVIITVLK